MTICPIAIVAGCKKCPAFSICPVKSVIGDHDKSGETTTKPRDEEQNGGAGRDD